MPAPSGGAHPTGAILGDVAAAPPRRGGAVTQIEPVTQRTEEKYKSITGCNWRPRTILEGVPHIPHQKGAQHEGHNKQHIPWSRPSDRLMVGIVVDQ